MFESIKSLVRSDGWENLMTGLGVLGKDKRMNAKIKWVKPIERELEELYAQDDMAKKIVNKIPDEGTREWIRFTGMDPDEIMQFQNKLDKISLRDKVRLAWRWSRLYGGAGIFLDIRDGAMDLAQPVDKLKIRTIASATVLHRFELIAQDVNGDITSPNYGLPETYTINSRFGSTKSSIVHHSRIVRFDGVELPRNLFLQNNYWGDSVLTDIYNSLVNFNTTNDSTAGIVSDFRINLLKLHNLADMMAAGKEDLIRKRIDILNLSRSVINTMLIGENEDFQQLTTSVSGVGELVRLAYDRLQAASGLPHTILFGEGSEGNTSGRSEKESFYDDVASVQEKVLEKNLNYIFELLFLSQDSFTKGQIPEKWGWEFNELWQIPATEQADIRLKTSQADEIDIRNGVLDASEVAVSRYGGDKYSTETKIDLEARSNLEPKPEDEENAAE